MHARPLLVQCPLEKSIDICQDCDLRWAVCTSSLIKTSQYIPKNIYIYFKIPPSRILKRPNKKRRSPIRLGPFLASVRACGYPMYALTLRNQHPAKGYHLPAPKQWKKSYTSGFCSERRFDRRWIGTSSIYIYIYISNSIEYRPN